jgi:hypothetical protein
MLLLSGVGKSWCQRVKETHDCSPLIGIIVLIIQWHKMLGMFLNSIKRETCVILENADHVLQILEMLTMSFRSLGCSMYVMVSMPVSWSFFRRAV